MKGNNNYQMNDVSLNYDQIEVSIKLDNLNATDFFVNFLAKKT